MESIILTRALNIGFVLENREKLKFAYCFSSSINLPDVSGIYGIIIFFFNVLESDIRCSFQGIIIFVDRCNLLFFQIKK